MPRFRAGGGSDDLYDSSSVAQLQQLEQEENQLQTEWGQLLLEEGAWSTPARIEQIATERLGMRIPDVNDVEVIRP